MQTYQLLAIVGSTRVGSSSHRLLDFIMAQPEQKTGACSWKLFDISTLPYFNQDLDSLLNALDDKTLTEAGDALTQVKLFREKIEKSDGVLIITPEYVFSLPGVLKNALEWLASTTLLAAKPMALITAAASGVKAKTSLELITKTLGGDFTEHTSILIPGIAGKIKPDGTVADPALNNLLKELLLSWMELIDPTY